MSLWMSRASDSLLSCISHHGIEAALQTAETIVCARRHRLDADKFLMFWLAGPGKDFVAI